MIVPAGAAPEARLLLIGRGLRAFVDGYVAVLLPAYLLALGFGTGEVGLVSTATLLGSALATLAVGAWGHRFHPRRLLLGAALLMTCTGLAFAGLSAFWPLMLIAFVGTLNPSSGDVSVFLPLEHARLAEAAQGEARSALSQMDVPTRSAFVMAVVTPPERAAAASFTAVPRSLAAALSPSLGGALFAAGWLAAPLLACGLLKITYDLALWQAFRRIGPGRDSRAE
jgi:MFS family permease